MPFTLVGSHWKIQESEQMKTYLINKIQIILKVTHNLDKAKNAKQQNKTTLV